MKKLNILLTGASGDIGFRLFKNLFSKKEEFSLSIFIRGSNKNKKLFEPYFDYVNIIWGDILELNKVKEAVKDQDVVIHLVALIPPKAYENPSYTYDVNVEGTKNLIGALKKLKNPVRIIYSSSIAVYGDRLEDPYIKVKDDPNPNDCYGITKLMAENIIRDSGLPYTILRFSYCASLNSLKLNPVLFRMPLATKLEIVHINDAALALMKAIDKEEIIGRTFIITGGEDCRILYKDFIDDIMEILGFGRDFFPEEAFAKDGFNCGYCETAEIQSILNFQTKDLNDFYQEVKEWIGIKKYFVPLVKWFIKKYLLRKSVYYQESRQN